MCYQIGKVYKHPDFGVILITGGAYERNGRISNFWNAREVKRDGTLKRVALGFYGVVCPEVKCTVVQQVILHAESKIS
jgi:hypothetical protein